MAPQRTAEDATKDPVDEEEEEPQAEEQEEQENDQEEQEEDRSASASASESPEPSSSTPTAAAEEAATQWQAVWAPQYNAYYFYNSVTQETTWTNPLQPEASSSSSSAAPDASSSASTYTPTPAPAEDTSTEATSTPQPQMSAAAAHHAALQAAALAQGIDPLLAHLDPSLLASAVPGSSGGSRDLPSFKASFNARTGQFAPSTSRTPGHLSEYERAKRMSEFYFDVGKWEEDLAKRGGRLMGEEGEGLEEGEGGKKRKRPTKKDIERFKEQKKQKKIAKTAWLRT